jgi:hypothetical protein
MGSLGPGGLENETGAVQDYLYLWEIAEKFMLFIDPIAMHIVCALYADGRGSTSGALGCPISEPYLKGGKIHPDSHQSNGEENKESKLCYALNLTLIRS